MTAVGLVFAALMRAVVALTLAGVALLAVSFRKAFIQMFNRNDRLLARTSRGLEIAAGAGMVVVAAMTLA